LTFVKSNSVTSIKKTFFNKVKGFSYGIATELRSLSLFLKQFELLVKERSPATLLREKPVPKVKGFSLTSLRKIS